MAGKVNVDYLFKQANHRDDIKENSLFFGIDYDFEISDQFDDIPDEVGEVGVEKCVDSTPQTNKKSVHNLLDLCARVVGKHKSCRELEQHQPPLDEPLLKKVAFWAFPTNDRCVEPVAALSYKSKARTNTDGRKIYEEWESGKKLLRNKCVEKMWQVGFMVTALIRKQSSLRFHGNHYCSKDTDDATSEFSCSNCDCHGEEGVIKVCLTFEQRCITSSTCTQCDMYNNGWCEHIVAAVLYRVNNYDQVSQYAPITDVLSTLNRDQLQKLLQYTISEDKMNVLHIVLKYLDDIRNVDSSISTTCGAPDPSFGLEDSTKTTMDDGKKTFIDNMCDVMENAYEQNSKCYTDGYDWSGKVISEFHDYVSKILELQKGGHYQAAADLYVQVLEELVENMKGVSEENYQALQEMGLTVHDISHMTALCMINPYNNSKDKDKLYKSLKAIAKKIPVNVESIPYNSEWAELPHVVLGITNMYEDMALTTEGVKLKQMLLGDALATEYIPHWPVQLIHLLNGETEWKTSLYNENIVLMLTRVESLMQCTDDSNCDQILRILPIVLRKLAMLAQKYSLLGEYVDAWQDVFDLNHSIPALRESKYQRCKNVVKRRKLTHNHFEPELSQSQITYALLFCLHLKKICEDASKKVFEGPLTTAPFCFLALELSRSRLYEGNLCNTEQSWLDKLENIVAKQIECQYGVSQPCTQGTGTLVVDDNNMIMWYLDALGSDGDSYYKHQVPMQLLKILFHLINKKQLQSSLIEKIVLICTAIITRIRNALDKSVTICARNKDFDMVGDLVEMFFDCLDVDNFTHRDLLIQVMENLTTLKYGSFQKRAFSAFYKKKFDLNCHHSFLMTSFHFALNAIRNVERPSSSFDQWREQVFSHIKKCIDVRGLVLLQDILTIQHNPSSDDGSPNAKTFTMIELSEILSLLKPEISKCTHIPENVHDVIKQCVSQPTDIYCLPELLDYFRSNEIECSYFEECIETLLANYRKLSSTRLFNIAKLYEEKHRHLAIQQLETHGQRTHQHDAFYHGFINQHHVEPVSQGITNQTPNDHLSFDTGYCLEHHFSNQMPTQQSHDFYNQIPTQQSHDFQQQVPTSQSHDFQQQVSAQPTDSQNVPCLQDLEVSIPEIDYLDKLLNEFKNGGSCSNTPCQTESLDLTVKPDKIMEIIEKAFELLVLEHRQQDSCFHSCQESNIKWTYEYCSTGGVTSKTFNDLIKTIHQHGCAHPKLVLMLLDVVDKNQIHPSHLKMLREALISGYKDFHIINARHIRSPGYSKLVRTVKRDQEKFCELFGVDYQQEYASVVEGIKVEYRTRRRLVRLLEEAFNS